MPIEKDNEMNLPKILGGVVVGLLALGAVKNAVLGPAAHSPSSASATSSSNGWKLVNAWPGDSREAGGTVYLDGLTYERCLAAKERWAKADPSSWFGCTNL